jgi:hypothetical protein
MLIRYRYGHIVEQGLIRCCNYMYGSQRMTIVNTT